MLNEIGVHWAVEDCPSILELLEIHEDEDSIYLVLEYQPQGTLMNTMERQS